MTRRPLAALLLLAASATAVADEPLRLRVPIDGAAALGPAGARVTIVEFTDYQCPFCARVQPTLARLREMYPRDLRLVVRHNPLPFHAQAFGAAEAVLAAGEQGKHWPMHERLFAEPTALSRDDLEIHAASLGLDLPRFRDALDLRRHRDRVRADQAEAERLGARGTPSFFVNGRLLAGAQPIEEFRRVIDEELRLADALLKARQVRPAGLYAHLMKGALERAPARVAPPGEDPRRVYAIDPGHGPSRGPAGAPVTVVVFSDFQCPFCARLAPTLSELMERFPGQLRLVWRDLPLPFHPRARAAAEAARAAAEQGRFWEMHDRIFAAPQQLAPEDLERHAAGLGLDMARFRGALDGGRPAALVDADARYAASVGVSGTPTTFINGRKVGGAQGLRAFAEVVEEELKRRGR